MLRDLGRAGSAFSGQNAAYTVAKVKVQAALAPLRSCARDEVVAFTDSEPPRRDVRAVALAGIDLQAETSDEPGGIPDAGDELTEIVADREGRHAKAFTCRLEEERESNGGTRATGRSTFEHAAMLVAIQENANFLALAQ